MGITKESGKKKFLSKKEKIENIVTRFINRQFELNGYEYRLDSLILSYGIDNWMNDFKTTEENRNKLCKEMISYISNSFRCSSYIAKHETMRLMVMYGLSLTSSGTPRDIIIPELEKNEKQSGNSCGTIG